MFRKTVFVLLISLVSGLSMAQPDDKWKEKWVNELAVINFPLYGLEVVDINKKSIKEAFRYDFYSSCYSDAAAFFIDTDKQGIYFYEDQAPKPEREFIRESFDKISYAENELTVESGKEVLLKISKTSHANIYKIELFGKADFKKQLTEKMQEGRGGIYYNYFIPEQHKQEVSHTDCGDFQG